MAGERTEAPPGVAPEGRFRGLIDGLPLAVLTLGPGGRIEYANEHLLRLVAAPREQVVGADWFERFLPPDVRDVLRSMFDAALREGTISADAENEIVTATGLRRIVRWKNEVLTGPDGRPVAVASVGDDVTDLRAAEAERRLVEVAVDSSGTGIAISGPTLELTHVNRAFLELWGYSRADQVLGRSATEFWKDPAAADEIARRIAWNGSWSGEMIARRADGSEFTARVAANLFRDRPGSPTCLVATFSDITDRVRLEEQLRHSQKMEAVGLLAGGVAHDFNNLLTVILSGADFLVEALPPGDARRADADQILGAAKRAESLTRQLLAFSRRQVLHPGLLDLNVVVGGVAKMIRRLIGEDVTVGIDLADAPLFLLTDDALLEQALLNLVVNARDAMPHGGRLDIRTRRRELAGAEATRLEVTPGSYVALEVADSGKGMDEATLARIFEPFFTTKPQGRGTGLGLSTVYGIARQGGGAIDVRSRPGEGSTFTLLFPAREAPPPGAERVARPLGVPPAPETPLVLIAEDEPAVRAVAERCLVQRGFRVRTAPDGEAALRIAAELTRIDLLLTDVVMPGMNGRQLAEALRLVHPRTPVLFMTGYTDDTALRLGIEANQVRILSKPFTPAGLVEAVGEAIRG